MVAGADLTREGNRKPLLLMVVAVLVSGHPMFFIQGKGCWLVYSAAGALFPG
jgi:hypothetical protein